MVCFFLESSLLKNVTDDAWWCSGPFTSDTNAAGCQLRRLSGVGSVVHLCCFVSKCSSWPLTRMTAFNLLFLQGYTNIPTFVPMEVCVFRTAYVSEKTIDYSQSINLCFCRIRPVPFCPVCFPAGQDQPGSFTPQHRHEAVIPTAGQTRQNQSPDDGTAVSQRTISWSQP